MPSVYLEPHDPQWLEEFAREAARIRSALGSQLLEIHHIGSTPVPGLHAKPIIDMIPVVRDITWLDAERARMEALGYTAWGEYGIPGRRYFWRGDAQRPRTHQAHCFQAGSPEIQRHVSFCAYLRHHPEARQEYEGVKLQLARQYPEDLERYTDGKTEVIRRLEAEAAAWRATHVAAV